MKGVDVTAPPVTIKGDTLRQEFGAPFDQQGYRAFLTCKTRPVPAVGFEVNAQDLNKKLYPFQRACVSWALRRGRAALFQDCGLGKTAEQLVWAEKMVAHTGKPALILAPLAVVQQTCREGEKFGVDVTACRTQADAGASVNVTNYEMLRHFNPEGFGAIVLDESSILKAFDGKVRRAITDFGRKIRYRLACTATPAPNDWMELGMHSEFLEALPHSQMLAIFFVHDSSGGTGSWRLKGHAENPFWRWLTEWAVACRKPSDLGYDDEAFKLPPLKVTVHTVESPIPDGHLFAPGAETLAERRTARRESLDARVMTAATIANATKGPVLLWCNLNAESSALTRAVKGAVEIKGLDRPQDKAGRMLGFADGKIRCLVSKPRIAGFGMNWQHCSTIIFTGLSDSYEQYYQAVRRCWRFGQKRAVNVHVVISEAEATVLANVKRKERDAEEMFAKLVRHANLAGQIGVHLRSEYKATARLRLPKWIGAVS